MPDLKAQAQKSGTRDDFNRALLDKLGAPLSDTNLKFLSSWADCEGVPPDRAQWNPFATTWFKPGSTNYNKVGVKSYSDASSGIDATAQTLMNGKYPTILSGLRSGDPTSSLGASSEWNTWTGNASYASTIAKKMGVSYTPDGTYVTQSSPTPEYFSEGSVGVLKPLGGTPTSQDVADATKSPALFIEEGTDTLPWFQDPDLQVANPHLDYPVSFKVLLDPSDSSSYLQAGKDGGDMSIMLNCSLKDMTVASRQVYQKTLTRTGIHITLWGPEPDLITGNGTTGAWLNYYGLTSLMSTKKDSMPSAVMDMISDTFDTNQTGIGMSKSNSILSSTRKSSEELVSQFQSWLYPGAAPNPAVDTHTTTPSPSQEIFRVAAQDMFMELLSLFKYNAVTRFKADNYDGYFSDRDQQGSTVWSERYGDSKYRSGTRNNDVMYRGYVVMKTDRDTYYGYFKSLTFTEDATSPYKWNFDFVFQVQKTLKNFTIPVTP